jgi:hypothetical protein
MWEDVVQDIIEENFVIEGIIDGEEVKTKLLPGFEACFREQKLCWEELQETLKECEYKTLVFYCIMTWWAHM